MDTRSEQCALCLKVSVLRDSHIVSESFYADLYEEPHRFSIVVADRKTKDRYAQKGIREPLLCHNCEQLICNEYETYGALAFRRIKIAAKDQLKTFTFESLDYRRFKLFQLSQLWRMALAKHPLWQHVILPEPMLENLRNMLISGDPSTSDCYGVMMEAVVASDNEFFDAFFPPITVLIGGYQFVLATFAGFSWYYCAHRVVTDLRLSKFFVATVGSIMVNVRGLKDAWHIQRIGDELESIDKLKIND